MFMKNIMYKTKQVTEALQSEELKIIDAMIIVECMVKSLRESGQAPMKWSFRFKQESPLLKNLDPMI